LHYLGWTDAYYGSQGVVKIGSVPVPVVVPKVSLANVIYAAEHDPSLPQGRGTHPIDVHPVERALVYLKYLAPSLGTDGAYGSSTVTAYSAWQRHLGFTGADANGIPGGNSLGRLGSATPYKFTVIP